MTDKIRCRVLGSFVLTLILSLLFSFDNQNGLANGNERKFKPGEVIDTGGGMSAKILQCRGAGENEECEVQYYRGGDLESTPRWESTLFLRTTEERVLNYKRGAAREQAPPEQEVSRPTQAVDDAEPKTNDGDAVQCSFAVPAGDTSRTARASDELFKRKVYDIYRLAANGTSFAPLRVGVTFHMFRVGKPFTNLVRVDRGVGAYRINDAAPPNAAIYPVISKHLVCEEYRDRILKRSIENKYACFKNKDGEWVCGADGIPKIKQLN